MRPDEHIRFESLLSEISAKLSSGEPAHLPDAVEASLTSVRRFFRADQCGIITVSDNLQHGRVVLASCAEGAPRLTGDLDLALRFPWTFRRVVIEREPAVISRLDDLPAEAAYDRATCVDMQIKSFQCFPIEVGPANLQLGLVCTGQEERSWPAEDLPRLRQLFEVLAGAMVCGRASAEARQKLSRLVAVIDAAGIGFAEWNPGATTPTLDARLREILGIDPEDEDRSFGLWLTRIDPETRSQLTGGRLRLASREVDRTMVEYGYEHPLRGRIWLRQSSRFLEDGSFVEAVEDVTQLRQALEEADRLRKRLGQETGQRQKEPASYSGSGRIPRLGPSARLMLAEAGRVAATDSTVLLLGETGSGKERLASYIHGMSRRADRPMVRVNCSAIPAPLLESELFGRESGSSADAWATQIGRFELADGSTLFLDEIGELPHEIQVKLLRVLEGRTIERVGSPNPIQVDVRIIAATRRDLASAVSAGAFRGDLYHRLNVFPITIPPLRDRREDIPLLVQEFVHECAARMGKQIDRVDRRSLAALVEYDWPGNVRELEIAIERAMITAAGPVLHVGPPGNATLAESGTTDLTTFERASILQALQDTGWRIRGPLGAAAQLGLRPTTLESRMKKLGLTRPTSRLARRT